MPALLVATTSVAALAAAYLTKVASDIAEARGRDTAMRASQTAVANLEIARNLVNAAPYNTSGNTALLAAMRSTDASGRNLLPACPVETEVEEIGDGWFLLRTFGEVGGVRKVAQATVRANLPITNYSFFVSQHKLGISGEPRGMIHSNDSIDFFFANGRYRDPISAVNGFSYRSGATAANTQLLGTSNPNDERKDILDRMVIADVAARADTLSITDNLIAEVAFNGASTQVDLFRPQRIETMQVVTTQNVLTGYQTVTVMVNTPIYRTETWVEQVPVFTNQTVTTTVSVPIRGTRTVTVNESVPIYGTRTEMRTVTRQRWVELPPTNIEGAGDVSGGGATQGRWESFQVQEPVQVRFVERYETRQVTRNESYIVRHEDQLRTSTVRVQTGTTSVTRSRQVIDRYEMVPTQRQQAVYTQQQVTQLRNVTIPEQFLERRNVASSGILYFAGPVRKLSGRVDGRMTVVTNQTARITGSVQYVDANNRTRMNNGTNPNLPYEPNPDYNGSSVLAVMARDDVIYSRDLPQQVEINGALITTEGTVAFDGLTIATNGETVTHQLASGTTAATYRKDSLRRLGGIVSKERPVSTYVDGNNNVVAGFSRGRSTMDQSMSFQNGGGIAPPGVMTEDRPVWGVTMVDRKLDAAAIRSGTP